MSKAFTKSVKMACEAISLSDTCVSVHKAQDVCDIGPARKEAALVGREEIVVAEL